MSQGLRYMLVALTSALLAAAPLRAADPHEQIIREVSNAFDRHALVGLGEHHRQEEIHRVYQALLSDARVICKIDAIAVEFGNSRLQMIADRFVGYTPGAPVSLDEKRSMWRDTGQWLVWDSPLYEQFFDAVRAANQRKACLKPVRVLLADPPIDWSKVTKADEYRPYRIRDQFFAGLLEREVLAKGLRALVIAGDTHLWRALPDGTAEKPTMGQLLEQRHPGTLVSFTMLPDEDQAAQLPLPAPPSLLVLHGTGLGRGSFAKIAAADQPIMMTVAGKTVERPMREVDWPPAEHVLDGLFNLGPAKQVDPDPAIYREVKYQAELRRRALILKEVHGIDFIANLEELLAEP